MSEELPSWEEHRPEILRVSLKLSQALDHEHPAVALMAMAEVAAGIAATFYSKAMRPRIPGYFAELIRISLEMGGAVSASKTPASRPH